MPRTAAGTRSVAGARSAAGTRTAVPIRLIVDPTTVTTTWNQPIQSTLTANVATAWNAKTASSGYVIGGSGDKFAGSYYTLIEKHTTGTATIDYTLSVSRLASLFLSATFMNSYDGTTSSDTITIFTSVDGGSTWVQLVTGKGGGDITFTVAGIYTIPPVLSGNIMVRFQTTGGNFPNNAGFNTLFGLSTLVIKPTAFTSAFV